MTIARRAVPRITLGAWLPPYSLRGYPLLEEDLAFHAYLDPGIAWPAAMLKDMPVAPKTVEVIVVLMASNVAI